MDGGGFIAFKAAPPLGMPGEAPFFITCFSHRGSQQRLEATLSRIAIFIDGAYLDYTLRGEFGEARIAYEQLSARLALDIDILRTYYYNCLLYQSNPPTIEERESDSPVPRASAARLSACRVMKSDSDNWRSVGDGTTDSRSSCRSESISCLASISPSSLVRDRSHMPPFSPETATPCPLFRPRSNKAC